MAWLGKRDVAVVTPLGRSARVAYEGGGWYRVSSDDAAYLVADLRHASERAVAKRSKRFGNCVELEVACYQTTRGTRRVPSLLPGSWVPSPDFDRWRARCLERASLAGKGCLLPLVVIRVSVGG